MKYKINMQEIKDDKKNGIITKEEYGLKEEEMMFKTIQKCK